MKNVYDGVAAANGRGEAVVELPDWFAPLNTDFRYQLTPLGSAAPDLHIVEEIANNRFKIAGAKPGMKVCWQVTGTRHDAWARAHRLIVEEEKPAKERGHYLHPKLHGASEERAIAHVLHPYRQGTL
jgi:hypothetical protein